MPIFSSKRFFIILILSTAAAVFWYRYDKTGSDQNQYKTSKVDQGDIVQTIAANGTLTPVVLVNVGTQVSGTVSKLYVDFNDEVKTGQVLAELDPALLRAQLYQSEANLLSAQATLKLAQSKLKRNRTLMEKGFISIDALDVIEQELDIARAQIAASKAQVARDRANLNYSIIKSPISGVVIARDVDIGQTVAANFQTPILFQIAKDLRQMQINISVAEADIGQLHVDQPINFTVDAFQERQFTGLVKQVRLNPSIQENVVTYNVVAMVSNDDGVLLPGMTANIQFIVHQRNQVLRVPNAALRYKPKEQDSDDTMEHSDKSVLYRLENNKPVPVKVTTGITDSNFTEIIEGAIQTNDRVITREILAKKESESKFRFGMF